jgi:transcriptional regulator with XRE-family HTH domain
VDYETFLQRVSHNLKAARQEKGLTLDQASGRVAGSTASGRGAYRYLWELEQGKRNPSLQMLFVLAERYGVTVADLVNVVGARPGKRKLSDIKTVSKRRKVPTE